MPDDPKNHYQEDCGEYLVTHYEASYFDGRLLLGDLVRHYVFLGAKQNPSYEGSVGTSSCTVLGVSPIDSPSGGSFSAPMSL